MDTKRFRERADYTFTPRNPGGSSRPSFSHPEPVGQSRDPISSTDPSTSTGSINASHDVGSPAASTNISIQINMPKVHMPKFHLPRLPYKRIGIWIAIVAAVIVLIVVGYVLVRHFFFKPKPVLSRINSQGNSSLHLAQPTFTPVAPRNKPQLGSGENTQLTSFDGTRDSYSYTDAIGGTPIVVSQQPIPSTFSSAAEAVQTIAKSINATDKIITNYSTAYEEYNAKSSTQTVVFSIDDVLVFIVCNFKHTNTQFQSYINDLV